MDYPSCQLIKQLRKSRHVSQLELESLAQLCFGTVSRIENGKVNPTKETLLKIVEGLKLNDDEAMKLFGIKTFTTNQSN